MEHHGLDRWAGGHQAPCRRVLGPAIHARAPAAFCPHARAKAQGIDEVTAGRRFQALSSQEEMLRPPQNYSNGLEGLWNVGTIDGSAANEAAIKGYNEEHGTAIAIRKIKYLNNIVEQDHRAVKRVTQPMLGFKSFDAAQGTLTGIKLMHLLKKNQMVVEAGHEGLTAAEQFYALAS